jgi:hypothetical protein
LKEDSVDSPETTTNIPGDTEAAHMSFFQRLVGVYFDPGKTFADISRKRSWVGMWILVSIVAIGANYTLMYRMDPADAAVKGMAMFKPILKKFMNSDQLAKIDEQTAERASQPRSFLAKHSQVVTTPVFALASYVVFATIFLLAFLATGAGISFRKAFTVTIWGTGPPAIVLTLLGILFMFVKNPADLDIIPAYNVVSNLGALVDFTTHPVLNSFLSSIDLFSIWTVVLLSLGFAAVSEKKLTAGKAAIPIVCLWALWILLKLGFWAIVS